MVEVPLLKSALLESGDERRLRLGGSTSDLHAPSIAAASHRES